MVSYVQCRWTAVTLDICVKREFFLVELSNRILVGIWHLFVACLFFFWSGVHTGDTSGHWPGGRWDMEGVPNPGCAGGIIQRGAD
jgi:hypothetical protein